MAEQHSRITIMDGDVVTFAQGFDTRPGAFGELANATGPYDVSASRNMVCVHKADLRSDADLEDFIKALRQAQREVRSLAQKGPGGNYRVSGMGIRAPADLNTEGHG